MLDIKNYEKAYQVAKISSDKVIKMFNSSKDGLGKEMVDINRKKYGMNITLENNQNQLLERFKRSFINPFSLILFILIIIAIFTDVIFANANQRSYAIILIMFLMILLSGLIRFIQESHSTAITNTLINVLETSNNVLRDGKYINLNAKDLVVGDIVSLKTGDKVGADMRIIQAQDCLVSQSIITGESNLLHKNCETVETEIKNLADFSNILFSKSNIVHGECQAVVFAVGKDSLFGNLNLHKYHYRNGFDNGSNSIMWVLIKFMIIIVPLVFIVSGITKGDWLTALIFALSVSIGLVPELLPMVITACLAKGSYSMAHKKTIVKNVNAMQSLGNMDVLCVDKTGTLTNDKIILEYYIDILGNESLACLNYARLSSYFYSDRKNHIDAAILKTIIDKEMIDQYEKISEWPFDYQRKYSSVLLKNVEHNLLIVKGNPLEVIKHCKYIKYKDERIEIKHYNERDIYEVIDDMLEEGMKVIAVAIKEDESSEIKEEDMTLVGYLAFFDAPKQSALSAIKKLHKLNVDVKVLTGDGLKNAQSICKRLNIKIDNALIGTELDLMNEDEALLAVQDTNLFAELNPKQKERIITLLQNSGHKVGYLADGINDLPAIYQADVAISVDNADECIKEASDVILLKKDLNVLEEGIITGRKAFVNMTKYIKITASSNLGNILSIVVASLLLPFFPMTSIQLLLLNLLYDGLCLVLPWDNVDESQIQYPLEWSGKKLSRFMCFFAPISSIFDILTFICLIFVICPNVLGFTNFDLNLLNNQDFVSTFQTAWFLESMWSQILILYSLRSKEISFKKSHPSFAMLAITILGVLMISILVSSNFGAIIGLSHLPMVYFLFLFVIVLCYVAVINLAKVIYFKRYGELI